MLTFLLCLILFILVLIGSMIGQDEDVQKTILFVGTVSIVAAFVAAIFFPLSLPGVATALFGLSNFFGFLFGAVWVIDNV